MGGLVARWALRTMENRGLAHESHTYVSFDSPQKGANVPMGIQALVFLASRANILKGTELWVGLNSPAARQLLLRHFSDEALSSKLFLSFRTTTGLEGPPGHFDTPISPIFPAGLTFTQTAAIRDQFKTEMASLGYSGICRNVGISCGSANGIPGGQGFVDGAPLLIAGKTGWGPFCGSGQEFGMDAEVFASNGGTSAAKELIIAAGSTMAVLTTMAPHPAFSKVLFQPILTDGFSTFLNLPINICGWMSSAPQLNLILMVLPAVNGAIWPPLPKQWTICLPIPRFRLRCRFPVSCRR